jgi:hypothetical protein
LLQQAKLEKAVLAEASRQLDEVRARESQRQKQQGLGRPIISVEINGTRFVAVGKTLYHGKWKTFFDFLGDYLKLTIGGEWGTAEIKDKPFAERHPILQWYQRLCELQRRYRTVEGATYSGPSTGATSAYYRLAYNLYLIAHNGTDIQARLIARLRNRDNFQGAFFETQVAAWLIMAGFELQFENEADTSSSHCEFTATLPSSGAKFSVEAKSRSRGEQGQPPRHLTIGRQLRKALAKRAAHQRLVFLELNRPIKAEEEADRIVAKARRIMQMVESLAIEGQPAPPAYVCLTNLSDHYFLESETTTTLLSFHGFKIGDFVDATFPTIREALRAREKHSAMFHLLRSIREHLHIPATFDGELPSVAFASEPLPRWQLGRPCLVPGPDGRDIVATLTSATVDSATREMIGAFHDPVSDKAWLVRGPLTQAEFEDYRRHPETFFGVYHHQGGKAETPIDLFDFFFESYKSTPKERLLEFLATAQDIEFLKGLSQKELAETYCERLTYSAMTRVEQAKSTAPTRVA